MKKFEGVNIKEVWNSRLSSATPLIVRHNGTWVIQIWNKNNPDYDGEKVIVPLEEYDTDIKAVDGDEYDTKKLTACFQWLHSVRDDYALDYIELRKPVVALIELLNEKAASLNIDIQEAKNTNDIKLEKSLTSDLASFLKEANRQIKEASSEMHKKIKEAV